MRRINAKRLLLLLVASVAIPLLFVQGCINAALRIKFEHARAERYSFLITLVLCASLVSKLSNWEGCMYVFEQFRSARPSLIFNLEYHAHINSHLLDNARTLAQLLVYACICSIVITLQALALFISFPFLTCGTCVCICACITLLRT